MILVGKRKEVQIQNLMDEEVGRKSENDSGIERKCDLNGSNVSRGNK